MKVLICIPCLMTGGTEIQTLNLVRALLNGRHQALIVCYFEHSDEMVERFRREGCNVICLSNDGSRIGGRRGIIFLYKGFYRIIKQYRPDIAHVQYMAPGAIPILLLRLLGVRQIIATAHTSADIYPSLRIVRFIQRHCVRVFTCITELAEHSFFGTSQLYTEQTQLKKRNHFTIHNTLPPDLSASNHSKAHDRPLTIGVVSRLEHIKGMDLVIPSFANVKKRHNEMQLLVVGDGILRNLMEQQAHKAGLEDSVEFAGRQTQDELKKFYDRIDILLIPSRSEGFGLTAIEGMANGCVVIAARTGGLPEVVLNAKVGLLHKPEQIEDIAAKINELIENPMQWKLFSTQATAYARRFSFDHFKRLFNDLYQKISY